MTLRLTWVLEVCYNSFIINNWRFKMTPWENMIAILIGANKLAYKDAIKHVEKLKVKSVATFTNKRTYNPIE